MEVVRWRRDVGNRRRADACAFDPPCGNGAGGLGVDGRTEGGWVAVVYRVGVRRGAGSRENAIRQRSVG